ncbi:nickel pincer cofactor biosynthesis protein LarB [Methanoplanus endosymbiosus]|uniref:Nickel pincer cofactor biosynthesis protein LarB n=1 Tax=Methanoplanus endosymbiosus TaxID=33865 RepID=A0A9E7TKX4_9EURY|nr:nickel pincer cofactor biosynthesis protein LarB [Methanoplanus endosymbiosus]UUX91696.1 nickel pincer cofactor biosynthesis protein LarB [Methanoplanus endosymbiosus]
MNSNNTLRGILKEFEAGRISVDAAEELIDGLRIEKIGEIANIDLGRSVRCGMPEVILAEGKRTVHLTEIVEKILPVSGRCLITRVNAEQADSLIVIAEGLGFSYSYNETASTVFISGDPDIRKSGGRVGIITAGTSDLRVAEEAKVIAEVMGCEVKTSYDVGAAGIHRLFPAIKEMLDVDAYVVCAGREGTLPTVIAGLVSKPVIGVPVSVGYGYMGQGQAALAGMLQSCAVLTVVNIDAGFTAGAFAARIANMAGDNRD